MGRSVNATYSSYFVRFVCADLSITLFIYLITANSGISIYIYTYTLSLQGFAYVANEHKMHYETKYTATTKNK